MLAAWHAKSIPCRKLPGSILNAWIHFTALDEATATGRSLRCSPPDLAGGMSKYNRRCPTSFSHRRPCKTMDRMVTWAMASSKSDEDGGGKKNVDVNHVESSSDKVLTYTNAATKWMVSGAAFCTLGYLHNAPAAWCLLCSIFSVITCKVLKKLLNEERPNEAHGKSDPGMPSSHANSLAYLSTYAGYAILDMEQWSVGGVALAGSLLATAMFLAWLRVRLGFHTTAQVVVGFILGSAQACFWMLVGAGWVLPSIAAGNEGLQTAVFVLCGLFCSAFAFKNISGFLKQRRAKAALA